MKFLPVSRDRSKPKFTKSGMRISPRTHKVRMVAYMILLPLLTWYGHQKYTNPFRFHPNVLFDGNSNALLLYSTSTRDTTDRYAFTVNQELELELFETVYISDSGFVMDSVTTDLFTFTESYTNWDAKVARITYFDMKIMIPLSDTLPSRELPETDLLLIDGSRIGDYTQWRNTVAPRLTILFNYESSNSLPSNVLDAQQRIFEIVEGRKKELIAKIPE